MNWAQLLNDGETVLCDQRRSRVKVQRVGSIRVVGSNFASVAFTSQRLFAVRMWSRTHVVQVPLTHLRSWEAVNPLRLRGFVMHTGDPFIRIEVAQPDAVIGIQVSRQQNWIEAFDRLAGPQH